MVALKAAQIDAFVAKPSPAQPVVLVFGPDAGLVRERAAAIIRASVDDPDDPFSLARLDGDELASEPTRLVEEANTIPLFGGRRAVWVKAGSRNIAPAVEALIADAAPDCRVVIEAGDLRKTSPLRAACERAKNAAALPCYADAERDLARLIDDEMRAAGLTIAPEAREALIPLLGGDRLASRSEINKLALYARGRGRVELDDIVAVVADASLLALDALLDAAFAGRTGDVEAQFAKARIAGTAPGTIVSAALRNVAMLHKARLAVDGGASPAAAAEGLRVHFRRAPLVEAALKAWSSARLARAMTQLADAALELRRQRAPVDIGEAIAHRTLLSLAVNARRKE
ncbi:MAG: polymerase subunit delta [Alphaproteobacteria bacterium]|nr:polymerase subunit delta [Alphaproteobacteria bacterium]